MYYCDFCLLQHVLSTRKSGINLFGCGFSQIQIFAPDAPQRFQLQQIETKLHGTALAIYCVDTLYAPNNPREGVSEFQIAHCTCRMHSEHNCTVASTARHSQIVSSCSLSSLAYTGYRAQRLAISLPPVRNQTSSRELLDLRATAALRNGTHCTPGILTMTDSPCYRAAWIATSIKLVQSRPVRAYIHALYWPNNSS